MTRMQTMFFFVAMFAAVLIGQLLEHDVFPKDRELRIRLMILSVIGILTTLYLGLAVK